MACRSRGLEPSWSCWLTSDINVARVVFVKVTAPVVFGRVSKFSDVERGKREII